MTDQTPYQLVFVRNEEDDTAIAVFEYCAEKRWCKEDILGLLCSLMEQLADEDPSIIEHEWQYDDFNIFDFESYLDEENVIQHGLHVAGLRDVKIHIFSSDEYVDADEPIKRYSANKEVSDVG